MKGTGAFRHGFLYDVFTSEGIYLKQAVVPYSIYVFKHGRAYGLVYPEDGFYSAKSFRLISTRPEGGG